MGMDLAIETMKPLRIDVPEPIVKHMKLGHGVCIEWGMDKERIGDIGRRE